MAHPINDLLNKRERRELRICDEGCKYFKYPHNEIACVLSEVYSVPKGTPCYEYTNKPIKAQEGDK